MKNQANHNHNERGSIILWIMIGIALLAALSFTLQRGSRTGQMTMNSERGTLAASELASYARSIKEAVRQLQINGCQASQISFANPVYYDPVSYTPDPATAPADESCHVFKPNGGNQQYLLFKHIKTDSNPSWGPLFTRFSIDGVTSGAADERVHIIINRLDEPTCIAINKALLNIDTYPVRTGGQYALNSSDHLTAANCPNCVGKKYACIRTHATATDAFQFYYNLIP